MLKTFQLLQVAFRFHHISTDEVFGSLGPSGLFSETTPYDPRSPYSATRGCLGESYCVGGAGDHGSPSERTNRDVVDTICALLDQRCPGGAPHARLITPVSDRPGHDRRYAIDPSRISSELGWQPRHQFEQGLAATVDWYLANLAWCDQVRQRAGYGGERMGVAV